MKRLLKIRNSLSYTLRMKPLILLGLLALTACGSVNVNGQLPAGFPADVPIISGEIYRAKRANFEDGPGFVVDVLTTLSCEEVFAFYADIVGPRGDGDVRVETTCSNTATRYVSIAVHLGQEGTEGLNMDQYNRVKGLKGDGEGLRELKQLKGTEELGLEGTEKLNTEGLDTPM
jgi:hypothetical protein